MVVRNRNGRDSEHLTLDQKCEKYDMARQSIQYRQRHGIPLDAPKRPGNPHPKGHPKGHIAKRECLSCKEHYPIRCKACPECGQPAPRKGFRDEQRNHHQ